MSEVMGKDRCSMVQGCAPSVGGGWAAVSQVQVTAALQWGLALLGMLKVVGRSSNGVG